MTTMRRRAEDALTKVTRRREITIQFGLFEMANSGRRHAGHHQPIVKMRRQHAPQVHAHHLVNGIEHHHAVNAIPKTVSGAATDESVVIALTNHPNVSEIATGTSPRRTSNAHHAAL
jgi:hypothetical protein